MSFFTKVVLVTGGGTGIGAAAAELFAKNGAKVAIVSRNEIELNAVTQRCQKFGTAALAIKADHSEEREADLIVKKTIQTFGKLDVLVNNAGILKVAGILSENFLKIYDEVMNANIRGPVRITHFAVPHLIKSKGNIVNVSSIAGTTTRPNNIVYRTSRAALNHFTRGVALELAPHGVRVNSVSSLPTGTDIFKDLNVDPITLQEMRALHKISETVEIADTIVYVAGDKENGVTGSDYVVDTNSLLL